MQSSVEVANLAQVFGSSLRVTDTAPVNNAGRDVRRESLPGGRFGSPPNYRTSSTPWLGSPMTVEDVVRKVLMVNSGRPDDYITGQHPCFVQSRKLWWDLGLREVTLENHIRLACGRRRAPLILLLNPTETHELPYDSMVERTETLKYIAANLATMGLALDDVPILDICPFLTDKWFVDLGKQDPARVDFFLDESYLLTMRMLDSIQPEVIFVCQCQTDLDKWKSKQNRQVAWKLCSRIERATQNLAQTVEVGRIKPHVVWGFHPGHVLRLRQEADKQDSMCNMESESKIRYEVADQTLTYLFNMLYSPFAKRAEKSKPQLEDKWNDLRNNIRFQQKCIERQEAAIESERAEIKKLEDELSRRKNSLENERRVLHEIMIRCLDMEQQILKHSFPI